MGDIEPGGPVGGGGAGGKFTLTSTEVKNNATLTDKQVFNSFGCSGENLSPQLAWADAPKDTKSFVLTVYDPEPRKWTPDETELLRQLAASVVAELELSAARSGSAPRPPG